MNAEISEELIQQCIDELQSKTRFKADRISYEIQDDFRFLLLSIAVDNLDELDRVECRSAAQLIDKLMPKRIGEYSWMTNFLTEGKIIDSYFGGDADLPDSGL
jgi:hypothetical protein